jgi:hypothetical protein
MGNVQSSSSRTRDATLRLRLGLLPLRLLLLGLLLIHDDGQSGRKQSQADSRGSVVDEHG